MGNELIATLILFKSFVKFDFELTSRAILANISKTKKTFYSFPILLDITNTVVLSWDKLVISEVSSMETKYLYIFDSSN